MNGIIIINKEANYTSRDVVNIVGKYLNTRKIGHTGTLDPLATGVLVLCVGEATKLVEILTNHDKEYIAEITLGISTDTLDITGNILDTCNTHIEKEKIIDAIKQMMGTYNQEVPIYSTVKIKGKKLYEYARDNKEVILPKREVEIKDIKLVSDIKYVDNKTIFSIRCSVSKGCYIRSLVRDIAIKLNTIGVMSKLNRTRLGKFKIEDSNTLEDIKNNNYKLIDIKDHLDNYKTIIVDDELEKKVKNGCLIKNIYNSDIVLFKNNDTIIALYKEYDKDKTYLKPWKMFKGGNI